MLSTKEKHNISRRKYSALTILTISIRESSFLTVNTQVNMFFYGVGIVELNVKCSLFYNYVAILEGFGIRQIVA